MKAERLGGGGSALKGCRTANESQEDQSLHGMGDSETTWELTNVASDLPPTVYYPCPVQITQRVSAQPPSEVLGSKLEEHYANSQFRRNARWAAQGTQKAVAAARAAKKESA